MDYKPQAKKFFETIFLLLMSFFRRLRMLFFILRLIVLLKGGQFIDFENVFLVGSIGVSIGSVGLE